MEAPAYVLEFEKPLRELTKQLDELRQQSIETNVDLAREIHAIEKKISATQSEIYSALTPWQKVQVARHPKRPYALDYVETICTGFQELHGDRQFNDDRALVGGTALWFAARHDATQFFLNAFDWLPGISRGLIVRIAQALNSDGLTALATGALSGHPYKLYAVHAGAQDIPLTGFLIVSAVARFVRFTLTATVAWLAGRVLHHLPEASRLRLHLYCWLIFYSCYFVVMG